MRMEARRAKTCRRRGLVNESRPDMGMPRQLNYDGYRTLKVGTAEIQVSSPLPLNALINAVAEKSEALKISILRP